MMQEHFFGNLEMIFQSAWPARRCTLLPTAWLNLSGAHKLTGSILGWPTVKGRQRSI